MSNPQNISKNFYLFSFLPALAYWYLESHYPIRIAVAGGLILSVLEISLEKIWTKHVHTLSKFNFFLLLLLGGMSLLGDEGIWFKLQPLFTGLGIGGFLIYRLKSGRGLMLEMMETMGKELPPKEILTNLEFHLAVFFSLYGLFMGGVAIWATTDTWLFFKTIGFYIVFFLFFLIEIFFIRRTIKKLSEIQQKRNVLSRL